MLRVDDLHVHYGRVAAVKGISLHVDEGEAVALVGPNGAGKTTMLAAVAGMVAPSAGTITLDGASLVGQAPERIVRRGIALVPEGRQIFGTLTVGENLRLGMMAHSDSGIAADLERVLELFPILRQYHGSSAGKLSGGEQQQLAIARALLLRPRLLLLDEPSLGLAPLVINTVFEVLEELRRTGTTILLVEQVVGRTIAFADRTYVLRNGAIVLSGTRAELQANADVTTAYLGF